MVFQDLMPTYVFRSNFGCQLLHTEGVTRKMAPKGSRSPMQDWCCLVLYLSLKVWEDIQNPQLPQLAKVDSMSRWLVDMGLRTPSEPTYATMAALLSMVDPSGANYRDHPPAAFAFLQTIKSRVRTEIGRARGQGRPIYEDMAVLPADPRQFSANMLHRFFPGGLETPAVDVQQLAQHARAWPLRETNELVKSKKQTALQQMTTSSDALTLLQQAANLFVTIQGSGQRAAAGSRDVPIEFLQPARAGTQQVALPGAEAISDPIAASQNAAEDRLVARTSAAVSRDALPVLGLEDGNTEQRRAGPAAVELAHSTPPRTLQMSTSSPGARVLPGGMREILNRVSTAHGGRNWSPSPWKVHASGEDFRKSAKRGRPAAASSTLKMYEAGVLHVVLRGILAA